MSFLDKAKAAASKAAEVTKSTAESAKKSFDEKSARADAAAIERENEGLSPEEIAAKDEAKTIITFSKLEIAAYLKYEGGDEFWGDVKNVGRSCDKAQMAGEMKKGMGGSGYRAATYYDEPRFRLKFKNESERRMKYVRLEIDGVNSVGDVVETETFSATGPVEPSKSWNGDWTDACFPANVRGISLKKITIEFFDGDDVVLEGKWLDKLIKDGAGAKLMNFMKA